MIPLRDVIPSRTRPFVTVALIAGNAIVFAGSSLIEGPLIPPTWLFVPAAMFLHDNAVRMGANMLCLWIFGDNVEDRMGHVRFLLFYVLCGAVAAFTQSFAAPGALALGPSGAIAGVIGAYFVMYPYSRIVTLVPIPFFVRIVEVPAVVLLAAWLLLQFAGDLRPFWGHIGGFAAGAGAVMLFRRRERLRVEWWNDLRT
jgi:membrane associated rhomboid family serine protease